MEISQVNSDRFHSIHIASHCGFTHWNLRKHLCLLYLYSMWDICVVLSAKVVLRRHTINKPKPLWGCSFAGGTINLYTVLYTIVGQIFLQQEQTYNSHMFRISRTKSNPKHPQWFNGIMRHTERSVDILQGKASIRLILGPVSSVTLAEQLGVVHSLCQSIWEGNSHS